MNCVSVSFVLMVAVQRLLAAVLFGNQFIEASKEVEENLSTKRRSPIIGHDHRTDFGYAGILSDEEEAEELKHLEPFEVKQRMKSILESMDQNKDGLIDRKELTDKLLETYGKLSAEEADSEFESSDLNEDGYITWKEYMSDSYGSNENSISDFEEDEAAKEEKEIFLAADVDKDGRLNKKEFRCFYTPEDYPHMRPVVVNDIMKRFDLDKNGKITFDEFIGERVEHDDQWLQVEHAKYENEYDVNNDGVLEGNEVLNWALPNNNMLSETEADELLEKSDKNKDGVLSFDEVLDNYLTFISPDSEGYYIFKDEL